MASPRLNIRAWKLHRNSISALNFLASPSLYPWLRLLFGPRILIIPILLTGQGQHSTSILPNFGVSRPSLDSCLVQSVTQLPILRAHETKIGSVVVVAIWKGGTITRVFTSDCSPTRPSQGTNEHKPLLHSPILHHFRRSTDVLCAL